MVTVNTEQLKQGIAIEAAVDEVGLWSALRWVFSHLIRYSGEARRVTLKIIQYLISEGLIQIVHPNLITSPLLSPDEAIAWMEHEWNGMESRPEVIFTATGKGIDATKELSDEITINLIDEEFPKKPIIIETIDNKISFEEIFSEVYIHLEAKYAEEAREVTLKIIRELLDDGLIQAVDSYTYEPWSLSIDETITRIEKEWDALGREPNIAEIVTFIATEKGIEEAKKILNINEK